MSVRQHISLWLGVFLALALVLHGDLATVSLRRQASAARPISSLDEFYSLHLDCGGIPIKTHDANDGALLIACDKIGMMLRYIPNVRANLIAAGAEMHIVGRKESITELPEYRKFKGLTAGDMGTIDRLRGIGGVVVACPEENLLELPEDMYFGMNEDVCVHEFAHAIHLAGLPEHIRRLIEARYHEALGEGLWSGAYAAKDEFEFFAETSVWYFGASGFLPKKGPRPLNGSDGLMLYDPKTYALLDDLYRGRLDVSRITYTSAKRLSPRSLAPSKGCEGSALLVFVNGSPSSYKVHWISFDGKRARPSDLRPYSRDTVAACVGHQWLVCDEHDRPVAIFVPTTPHSVAVVN